MLYQGYQAWNDLTTPWRIGARMALGMRDAASAASHGFDPFGLLERSHALLDLMLDTQVSHERPAFGITHATCDEVETIVREEVVLDLPFSRLLHFSKPDHAAPQPKMLVVAPLSGHFATLLRGTVQTLLRDHDVYVTDWKNARDVPLEAGHFDLDEYIDYLIAFLAHLGPDTHMFAVCQPCVPALAATALMAEDGHDCQPRSLTLMGGPVDARVAPTAVNELACSRPLSWFEKNLIQIVPGRHPGRGRRVYPGFLQLGAFMGMHPDRHSAQFRALFGHVAEGRDEEAARIRDFYAEYLAVLDMPAEFYLETVDLVFQRAVLARGELEHRGRPVRPQAIRHSALLTIEGENDDICAVGQTAAAHDLCTSLPPELRRRHVQPGVGHYGLFAGSRWETQIYPQIRDHVSASR